MRFGFGGQKENMSKFPLQLVILVSLCIQNAGYTLMRKYSTQTQHVSSREILLVGEVIKVAVSTYLVVMGYENHNTSPLDTGGADVGVKRLMYLISNSHKMLFLAIIYGIMNILSFVSLQYIGAGEFTVCAQLKILTTASFSVIILNNNLSWAKWRALALLVLSCILVASPSFSDSSATAGSFSYSSFIGYGAVMLEVILSGFASIYFEKVVKSSSDPVGIWERNFQLGLYSLFFYALYIGAESMYAVDDASAAEKMPVFANWTVLTFAVSCLGALGGLLVAATLKYADSILKTLATAGAIVIATYLGHVFLDGPFDIVMSIGCLSTIVAICNYSFD